MAFEGVGFEEIKVSCIATAVSSHEGPAANPHHCYAVTECTGWSPVPAGCVSVAGPCGPIPGTIRPWSEPSAPSAPAARAPPAGPAQPPRPGSVEWQIRSPAPKSPSEHFTSLLLCSAQLPLPQGYARIRKTVALQHASPVLQAEGTSIIMRTC